MQYQVSTALISASPQVVWSVLTDYDQLTDRFTRMKSSKLLRQSENAKVLAQQVQPLPPYPAVSYVVEVTESFLNLLSWRGLSSYIKFNLGYFSLNARDAGRSTFVVYAKYIAGAIFVPEFIIQGQLEQIMPNVLMELRECAESLATTHSAAGRP
jgi:hypothetical protein